MSMMSLDDLITGESIVQSVVQMKIDDKGMLVCRS